MALYGGFPSGGGPWETRDPNLYRTVLSGDLLGNDTAVGQSCDLLTEPTRSENSYHVVTAFSTDETAAIDGVTITGGNANDFYPQDSGGGMFCWVASPNVANCTLIANSAASWGGAIFNYDGSPALKNCTFTGNCSTPWAQWGGGGAIYNEFSYSVLDNCVFEENCAAYGGAVWNYNGSPTFTDCRFVANTGNRFGGGMANHDSTPTIIDCTFADGYSRMGGGISNSDSNSQIIDTTFTGNSADWWGGGIHNYRSEPNLSNCIIAFNTAGIGAGGIYVSTSASLTLTNCTLADNSAPQGSGVACDSYQMTYPSSMQVTGSILWDDANEILNNDGSAIGISFSNIIGDWNGPGNIDTDPCFADLDNGDLHLISQAGRWNPYTETWVYDANTSSCIDAGDPNADRRWELWPHGKRINMGAYGGTLEASMSLSQVGNIADLNTDGGVDDLDLLMFSEKWLRREVFLCEDLDRNGFIDFVDFAIFADNWHWAQ
ncbi:MAG: hypothetical protein ACYS4W_07315 [Planctomycetota bacterium]